jgi:hypothetical protein
MEDSPLVKAALQVKPLRTTATPLGFNCVYLYSMINVLNIMFALSKFTRVHELSLQRYHEFTHIVDSFTHMS